MSRNLFPVESRPSARAVAGSDGGRASADGRPSSRLVVAVAAGLVLIDAVRLATLPAGVQTTFTDGFEAFVAALCAAGCALAVTRSSAFARGQWVLVVAFFLATALADTHDLLTDLLPEGAPALLPGPLVFAGWFTYLPLALLVFFPLRDGGRTPWTWLSALDFLQVALVLAVACFHYVYLPHASANLPWAFRIRPDDVRNVVLAVGLLLRALVDPSPRSRAFYRIVGGSFAALTAFVFLREPTFVDAHLLGRPACLLLLGVLATRWRDSADPAPAPAVHGFSIHRAALGLVPSLGPVLVMVLVLAGETPAPFLPAMHTVIGASIAIFVARTGLAEYYRQSSARLQDALYRIAERAGASGDLAELYGAMHEIVGELLDARNFYVALYDSSAGTLSFPYFVDERDPKPAAQELDRGLTAYVLRTGRPLLASPAVRRRLLASGEAEGTGSPSIDWLGAPLKSGDTPFGVIAVQSYSPNVRYRERDEELLSFVAQHIAAAIERKRAEDAARINDARYRHLFERNLAGVFRSTRAGRMLDCNEAFARIFGFRSREEVLAASAVELYEKPRDRTDFLELLAKSGQLRNHEETFRRKDGKTIWTLENVSLSGDVIEGTLIDVTEHRLLEEQLRQAQKMEAIGRLAGGVAHDFNNLLTVVLGYSEALLEQLEAGDPRAAQVGEIQKAAERAASLTRQLLAFSRKQVLQPKVLDLNAVLAEMEKMLRRLIGADIDIRVVRGPELWPVKADPGQLEQVILNLALNARDAMPLGGRITLETTNVALSAADVEASAFLTPGHFVMLSVRDTGHGMAAEVREHIFEPFYTTKEMGKGTGLGLATVYGILEQSGGHVDVESETGKGSTFRIYLPRAGEHVELLSKPFTADALAKRRGEALETPRR